MIRNFAAGLGFSMTTVISLLAAPLAGAAEYGPLDDTWTFSAGAYFNNSNTTIRADGSIGDTEIGTSFDAEDLFGLGESNDLLTEAIWRFKPRHKLTAFYFKNDRSGTGVLDADLIFDGETFPIDASVTATFDTKTLEFAYEYDFLQRENYEIGASAGIHNTNLRFALDSTITIGGQPQSGQLVAEIDSNAPLPVLGFRGIWRLGQNFYATGVAQYFYLSYGAYSGYLQGIQASLKWQFAEHFAVGAGYNYFALHVDVEDSDRFNGSFEADRGGALLFLSASF